MRHLLDQAWHPDGRLPEDPPEDPRTLEPECEHCGSTHVRWRRQGGEWVLFSLHPGVVHLCAPPSDFD